MEQLTVLLADSDLGDRTFERDLLIKALDAHVVIAECASEQEVVDEVERHDPHAIVTQWAPVGPSAIAASTRLRLISRIGIGIDMIDVDAARAAEVEVRNVPHYCTEEVATHAVAMALALWRRLPQLDGAVRRGEWDAATHASAITRLSDATVGLIGCGRIGTLVGRAFQAWGSTVIAADPAPGNDGFDRVSVEELAGRADVISLHAPLVDDTRHIVDAALLGRMARAPVLVNTSRGPLVDTSAAAHAVTAGQLRGLGLDVFEEEPLSAGHPVLTAPHTLLAPHAAWCSREALPDLRTGAIDNVVDFFSTQEGGVLSDM